MRVTHLRALRDKYEQMLRLRQLHARAKAEPDFVEPDPRAAMAALARTWPGALREVDELPLETIESRIAELALAERDPSSGVKPWMRAQYAFHRLARGALAVKRWLAGRPPTPELEEAFTAALLAMTEQEREDVMEWRDDLAAVANPPRGRVMDLVYVKLARELGVDVKTARAAALPPPRRAASAASLRGRTRA